MPGLDNSSIEKLREMRKEFDSRVGGDRTMRARWAGLPYVEEWYELAGNLDVDGQADAHPVIWSAATAAYATNAAVTRTVKDLTSSTFGLQYERIRIRPTGSTAGTLFEVIRGGAQVRRGVLAAELAQGGSANCTVTVRTHDLTVVAYDAMLNTSDHLDSGSIVFVAYNLEAKRWEVIAAGCPPIV